MSGVVISEYWLREMGNPSTVMTGTITALYDIGGVFGALIAAFTVESLGRKRGLMVGAALIVIGSVLMGVSVERVLMIVGRIITGLGKLIVLVYCRGDPILDDPILNWSAWKICIGLLASVAPVYQSEICLSSQRGWHLCCQLTMMLLCLRLVYWINYAFYFHSGSIEWRFPLLFQAVFAPLLFLWRPFYPILLVGWCFMNLHPTEALQYRLNYATSPRMTPLYKRRSRIFFLRLISNQRRKALGSLYLWMEGVLPTSSSS